MSAENEPLDIIVIGASGDLARKKIFPALFALYCQEYLPGGFSIYGFARSQLSDGDFRKKIEEKLTCRYTPGESCADRMNEFLSKCRYVSGDYSSTDSFLDLFQTMSENGAQPTANRLFYLAIPPSIFTDVARSLGSAGLVHCGNPSAWSRAVIEKPFGRDRASSDKLTRELANVFSEDQTYRIDHYLGKEIIQNLMVLRFANTIFDPLWNRQYVDRVCINWKEDIGVEGRAGYFDSYGIIRDVIQNHLLQTLALVAMERPANLDALHVRREKVRVLKSIPPLEMNMLKTGQYTAGELNGKPHVGYIDEDSVSDTSLTSTYALAVLRIENERWRGVPFIISAGKGLNERVGEVTIHFKDVPGNIFCNSPGCLPGNRLVIRIQPDEAIYLKVVNKEPGLDDTLVETELNLKYKAAFKNQIPDAYECLLLDIINGDKSLFISSEELAAAWDIFTPVLHEIEKQGVKPELYPFGTDSADPVGKLL